MMMGYVHSYNGNLLEISPNSWAPGAWAGMEGVYLENGARVVAIDLHTRTLTLSGHHGILPVGCPVRIDVGRSWPTRGISPSAGYPSEAIGLTKQDLVSIVSTFTYKKDYKLTLHEAPYGFFLRLIARIPETDFADGQEIICNLAISTFELETLTLSRFRDKIFQVVNKLEKIYIIKYLKFNGIQYLPDNLS